MTKTPIDYSKTVIYKIVCNNLNIQDTYVGSTTQFTKRKAKHKCIVTNTNDKLYSSNLYTTIRKNGGWINWSMIEIEKYPCKDSNESRARERFWCEQLNANLNSVKPFLTQVEINNYKKEYRDKHKDVSKEYNKAYRKKNMNKFIDYEKSRKEKKKEYNEMYYNKNFKVLRDKRLSKNELKIQT